MESEEGLISVTSPPPSDSELMVIGCSPDDLGFQEPEQPSDITIPSSSSNEPVVLTNEIRDKIIRQVEYYFSDENLPSDKFLMKYVKKDKEGFVPVALIASFRKMKKLVRDSSLILAALQESTQLVLSSDGKKVRRIHPLSVTEVKDAKSRTVLVENLPDNYSTESIQRIFGDAGNIMNISIHDPHAAEESRISRAEKLISGKIHALVEYATVEAAEKAVVTLNDEKNWRTGMRVELLLKRMGKYGLTKKGWKGTASEKISNAPAPDTAGDEEHRKSTNHHDETPEQEEEGHVLNERTGRRSRNRGRSSHKQYNHNGQGHGTLHHGPGVEGSKPPPGPRMPDGTRGFTMGRGRPLVSNQNSA